MNRYNMRRRGTNRIYVDKRGRGSRIQTAVILVLLAALIVLAVYALPALRIRQQEEELIRSRMLAECDLAVTRVQRLSRTAGSNSTSMVAEIRSYIYAMDTLNEIHANLTGERLLDGTLFTNMYALIESYSAQLLTGSDTGANQTAIADAIGNISSLVEALN